MSEGCTGTEAGLLADPLCRQWILLPRCHLVYSLTYIVFITSQCDRWGEIASMFGGTFLSPVIRGAPVWVPQWDLSLDKSQPRICLYSCIQAPRLTVTSSLWCCSLLWKHPWVSGELFCSFVYALTKCMSHIIRTLFSERRSSSSVVDGPMDGRMNEWMHTWMTKGWMNGTDKFFPDIESEWNRFCWK